MNSKFLKWAGCLATALALAACSSEEIADSTQLPEGKYPITFTATGLQAMAVSRATIDGTWAGSEKVSVRIGYDTKEYVANATGELTSNTPFYWQTKSDSYYVKTWIWAGGSSYSNNLPSDFTISADQSDSEYYQKSDFLYAKDAFSYTERDKSLTFYHQTAKVVVHVIKGDNTPTNMVINNLVTRKLSSRAQWVPPTQKDDFYGSSTAIFSPSDMSNITPLSLGKMDITSPDNKGTIETLASYKFLIVPQEVEKIDGTLFTITADNYEAPFNYTPTANIEWEAGREYTYYITIKGSKVTATVTTNIGWTDSGATGEGSVEI